MHLINMLQIDQDIERNNTKLLVLQGLSNILFYSFIF